MSSTGDASAKPSRVLPLQHRVKLWATMFVGGGDSVAMLCRLRHLDLSYCAINDDNSWALFEAIKVCDCSLPLVCRWRCARAIVLCVCACASATCSCVSLSSPHRAPAAVLRDAADECDAGAREPPLQRHLRPRRCAPRPLHQRSARRPRTRCPREVLGCACIPCRRRPHPSFRCRCVDVRLCSRLRVVDVGVNPIGEEGARALVAAFHRNTTLQSLGSKYGAWT